MNGGSPIQPPRENLKATRILFGVLVSGVFFFLFIAVLIRQFNTLASDGLKEYGSYLKGAAVALGLICLLIAVPGYRKGITEVKNLTEPLNGKLNFYRSVLIKYLALCEAPALFGIVVFILTGDYLMLVLSGIMLLAMLTVAPTAKKVRSELNLDWKEQQELE